MSRSPRLKLAAAALLVLLATGMGAPAVAVADPQWPEDFAARFVEAVRSGEPARPLALLHPTSRARINAQTQTYYDWIFGRQARTVIGAYRASAQPLDCLAPVLPPDGQSDYPVRPSHQLQIDFAGTTQSGAVPILFVVHEKAGWREVLACPRGDVVARMRERQQEDAALAKKVDALRQAMPAAQRGELLALLRDGRKVEAIRRYAAASDEELLVAKRVVESLEPAGR